MNARRWPALALLIACELGHPDALEQRIAARLQSYCATLEGTGAQQECLADVVALRDRHVAQAPARAASASERGVPAEAAPHYTPSLPTVTPIAPLRIVQRRTLALDLYAYRLSDGTVWQDLEAARSRLRPNALVRIVTPQLGSATFLSSSNERRRVRLLDCNAAPRTRADNVCTLLREGALTF